MKEDINNSAYLSELISMINKFDPEDINTKNDIKDVLGKIISENKTIRTCNIYIRLNKKFYSFNNYRYVYSNDWNVEGKIYIEGDIGIIIEKLLNGEHLSDKYVFKKLRMGETVKALFEVNSENNQAFLALTSHSD